jgi:integrase
MNGEPLTTRTLNNLLRLIGSLLHFARRQKYLNRELVEEITEIDLGRNAPTETGIFSPEDLRKLLDHCPEDLIAPLAIGAFCGLRTSELGRLDWRAVDLDSGFIRIEAKIAKTATRRLIPIPDNLRAWLEPIAKDQGPINPSTDDRGLNHRLVRGPARSAQVVWVKNGLRHSFCSYRLAQTNNAAQVALEAGNSPTMIFRHYRELVTPAQAEAWFSIRPKAEK